MKAGKHDPAGGGAGAPDGMRAATVPWAGRRRIGRLFS